MCIRDRPTGPEVGLPDFGEMKVGAIKAELQARGVPTAPLIDKAELVQALRKARQGCA